MRVYRVGSRGKLRDVLVDFFSNSEQSDRSVCVRSVFGFVVDVSLFQTTLFFSTCSSTIIASYVYVLKRSLSADLKLLSDITIQYDFPISGKTAIKAAHNTVNKMFIKSILVTSS